MKALLTTLTLWTVTLGQRHNADHRFQRPLAQDFSTHPASLEQRSSEEVHSQSYSKIEEPTSTPVPIIKLSKQMSLDGSYKSSYETGNSIVAEESGFLKNFGGDGKDGIVQYGSYSYTDPLGRLITVKYTADEGGFRAEGEHLPTPPPVPPEVQKGLDIIFESIKQRQVQEAEYLKSGAEAANFPPEDDGSYKPSLYN